MYYEIKRNLSTLRTLAFGHLHILHRLKFLSWPNILFIKDNDVLYTLITYMLYENVFMCKYTNLHV